MRLNMKWLNVTVLCLFCVVKCTGMSKSELEDFADHLEKTSKLDVILKKGNPENDDEEEEASDHAWEDSGKFEGDLILNERQRRLLVEDVAEGLARNGLKDSTKRWPDNEVVFYIQKEHFNGDQVQAIEDGIQDLAQASCIKFRPYQKGDRDAVVIQGSRRGCFSQVGYQGGYQVLNLSRRHPVGRGCFRHGTVVHELLHTLGFYHMQSSPDRDDYIDVLWENIVQPARHNFRKYNSHSVSDFGVGYDYDSVLHYSRRAFSANGRDTLVPKESGASIGQRTGLSDKDTKKLNKMYCDADSNSDAIVADEGSKQKTKKKKPKEKPFQGHGIGYHQGKTVVIKVNPQPKTYKITSTVPQFHVIDHFSQTPQALSPTLVQGVGPAEEVEYSYTTPIYDFEAYRKAIAALSNDYSDFIDSKPETYINSFLDKNLRIPESNDHKEVDKNVKSEETTTKHQDKDDYESYHQEDNDKNVNSEGTTTTYEDKGDYEPTAAYDAINDSFDRLGQLLKTHVYPSQTPDLDIYKFRDYSEFVNPKKHVISEPEVAKVESHLPSLSSVKNHTRTDSTAVEKSKLPENDDAENIETYEHDDHGFAVNYPHISEEQYPKEDSSYKLPYLSYEKYITTHKPKFYNEDYYSQKAEPPYKSSAPFYENYDGSADKSFKNLYKSLKEVGDTSYNDKEELKKPELTSKEKESSYGTSYPLNQLKKVEEESFETPLYAVKDLEQKNNYSQIYEYDPKRKYTESDKENYTLLGLPVPLQETFYAVEDEKSVNDKYNKASYTLPLPSEKESPTTPIQLVSDSKAIQIHGKLPSGKKAYHLFGVLVPLTQDWFKVNYDPHKSSYSVEKSRLSKDDK